MRLRRESSNEKIRVYDKGVDRPTLEAASYNRYAELLHAATIAMR
jgi:hypothetical protein